MKKCLLVVLFLSANISAEVYTVKKKNLSIKVSLEVNKDFEVKESFLNTPLLIWSRELKHHGPSIGLFPLASLPKHALSSKASKSNLNSFKKEKEENLKSLRASKIAFGKPKLDDNQVTYTYSYNLPGSVSVYSTEVLMNCSGKGLKVTSVVRKADYKKFKSVLTKFFNSIKCPKI